MVGGQWSLHSYTTLVRRMCLNMCAFPEAFLPPAHASSDPANPAPNPLCAVRAVNYGLEKLNRDVSAWMRAEETEDGGKASPPFLAMGDSSSVMWNRSQSKERFPSPNERYSACRALQQALQKIGASRLVVGHTPQISGANCECDGQVWRMDVGMSYGVLNRPVQVLLITKDAAGADVMTVLSESYPATAVGVAVEA
jgi:hypothetical protein